MRTVDGLRASLLAALFLAALSTLGDWIWARYIPNGQVVHGLVHGALICAAIGLALALAWGGGRTVLRMVLGQLAIGVAVAASFYPLYGLVGGAALFITWMALWVLTALLHRWARADRSAAGRAALRGAAAAVLSGLAFGAVSGIWTRPDPEGPNLLWHFACWTFAFLPGFLALLLRRGG